MLMMNYIAKHNSLSIDFTKAWLNLKLKKYSIAENLPEKDKLIPLYSLITTSVVKDVMCYQ